MANLLQFKFLYNSQLKGLSVDVSNLKQKLVIREIITWKNKDKLNKLNELVLTVPKRNVDLNEVYFERPVFVPLFGFTGYVTGIGDIDDEFLEITIQEEAWLLANRIYDVADDGNSKEYTISLVSPASLSNLVQTVLDSANLDMPFTWELGEDIPATSDFEFDVKWKNHYELLQLIAINSVNDLWFDRHKVYIGKKGKTIVLDRRDKLYKKLQSKLDLDTYGNIVNIVGAKDGGVNLHKQVKQTEIDFQYNYERVVSNNNLKSQTSIDNIAPRILDEYNRVNPDVVLDVESDLIHKYNMKSGDVIKIISNTSTQNVKGFYRLIEVTDSNTRSAVKLQFSKDGKFIPRISDSLDILKAALIKIKEIEMNS